MSIFNLVVRAVTKTADKPEKAPLDAYRYLHPVQPLLKPEAGKPGYTFQDYALRMNSQVLQETGWEPGYLGSSLFVGPRTPARQRALEAIPYGAFPLVRQPESSFAAARRSSQAGPAHGVMTYYPSEQDPSLPVPGSIVYPSQRRSENESYPNPSPQELARSTVLEGAIAETIAHELAHAQQRPHGHPWSVAAMQYVRDHYRAIPEHLKPEVAKDFNALLAFHKQFIEGRTPSLVISDVDNKIRYVSQDVEFAAHMVPLHRIYRFVHKNPTPSVQEVYDFARPLVTVQTLGANDTLIPTAVIANTLYPDAKEFIERYLGPEHTPFRRAVIDVLMRADNATREDYRSYSKQLTQLYEHPELKHHVRLGMKTVGTIIASFWVKHYSQLADVARRLTISNSALFPEPITNEEIENSLAFWKHMRPDLRESKVPLREVILREVEDTRRQLEAGLRNNPELLKEYTSLTENSRREVAAQLWSMRETARSFPAIRNFLLRMGLISSAFLVHARPVNRSQMIG